MRKLRKQVNRESTKLRLDLYKSKVRNINELSPHAWWKNMKHRIGQSPDSNLEMQCLANKNNDGDCLESRKRYKRIPSICL